MAKYFNDSPDHGKLPSLERHKNSVDILPPAHFRYKASLFRKQNENEKIRKSK
jgi:hypothetical protein